MDKTTDFAKRVKLIREALGMNKNELAKELGMSSTALLNIEYGRNKPGHDFYEAISRKLNVNLYYLFHGQGPMFRNKKEEEFFWGIYQSSNLSEKDLDRLLYYLGGSQYVQYMIMGELNKIIDGNAAFVEKEIEKTISERRENES